MITVYTWYIVVYALRGVERSWTADVYVIHYSMIPGIMHGFPRGSRVPCPRCKRRLFAQTWRKLANNDG